jgi:hypothetical protein
VIDFNNKVTVANEIKHHCRRMDYVRAAYFLGIFQCVHGVDAVPISIVQAIIGASWHKVDYTVLSQILEKWEV